MSKKTLNSENLTALGAERLAELLIEVSTGSAEIKRRLRLEISHNLGSAELAREVRKRLTTLRKSRSYVGWRRRKALIRDLNTQAEMILEKIASDDPTEAFDLLWQFIDLAPSIYERVDDSRGEVGDIFRSALSRFQDIAPRAALNTHTLATRVWEACLNNDYGQFDGLIGLLAVPLGDEGFAQLKTLVQSHLDTPDEAETDDHAALLFLRDLRGTNDACRSDHKRRLVQRCLQEIATAQGDTAGYIAQYSDRDLRVPGIAAEVAQLMLSQGDANAALDLLAAADLDIQEHLHEAWDTAYIDCLLALGRLDEAQDHRWACFCETLDVTRLKEHLKQLPDFDDIEAEDQAKAIAMQASRLETGLTFFLEWPDLGCAAELVKARTDELDGAAYHILTPLAEALREKHPLAAVLLWRAMIDCSLQEGRSTRYAYAADHLKDCATADGEIDDYGQNLSHHSYMQMLRAGHDRKSSFWKKLH